MANFDYTKYSYDDLVSEITRLLSNKDEWKDAYQSSTGQVLIQVVAALTDQLHYMLERRSQENFLPTARLQTSVNSIVNMLGYRPTRKVSANGILSLTLVDDNGTPVQNTDTIIIPKYSRITFGDNFYTNDTDITLLSTQTYPYTFQIKEGSVVSNTYDPSDTAGTLFLNNYVEIADYLSIENTSLFIYTSTQTFIDVIERIGNDAPIDALSFASATDQSYDINNTNSGLRINFGDGATGEKPTGLLTLKYIESSGKSVEVNSTGNGFVFDDHKTELVDDSAAVYKYTLTNTTVVNGGADEETTAEIKINAPSYVRTANRAASKDDYVFWVNKSGIGGIVDASAYGEEEVGITTVNANNVYIVYLTDNGLPLSAVNLESLDDYMDNYKIVTTQNIYESATVIPLQIQLKIKRNPTLTASNGEVYAVFKNELVNYFEYKEGILGKNINHSELVDYFHDFTIVKSGIVRLVSDYININIKALYAFSVPWRSVADIDVLMSYGSNGDTYTIIINDIPYSYTSQGGNTVTTVVDKMYQLLSLDLNVIPSIDTNTITLSRNKATVENLLSYSEELDNAAWTTTGTLTITNDAAEAPNGLTVATNINDTDAAVASNILQTGTIPSDNADKTVSVYIKKDANTARFPALYIRLSGGTPVQSFVSINTQTGATAWISGAVPTIVTDNLVDFWRVSITLQNNTTNNVIECGVYPAYSSTLGGAVAVALTGSVDIFGLQAENKTTAGKYLRTTIKPLTLAYAENAIENRLLYNEELDNAAWVKTGTTITPNSINDSAGYATVDLVTFSGAGAGESVAQTISNVHSGKTYTFACTNQQGTLTSTSYGVYDDTNAAWIIDPATNTTTLPVALGSFSVSFIVPLTCNSITIHPAYNDDTTGTLYIGECHLRLSSNSTNYLPSHEKQSFYYDDGFFVTNAGTTTVGNALINTPIQLPLPVLDNSENDQVFYPSSIEIITTDGAVLAVDDGAGVIYGGTVDYTTGLITIPLLPDDDYYIRYSHNVDQNFSVNAKQTFTYSLPKNGYVDTTELLSTIEITN